MVRGKFFAQVLSGELPIPEDVSLDMEKINQLHESVTQSSKDKYSTQAKHNSIGLRKAKQFFAARFGYIFAELNGHSGDIFDMNIYSEEFNLE